MKPGASFSKLIRLKNPKRKPNKSDHDWKEDYNRCFRNTKEHILQ